ncbi:MULTISPECIES: YlaH-like family protein [Neobacillus]|uniref:YlaH-like family protein n=1 Tax=Neobacillus sedimentimangrovi TaxID=2699460 RepID=A0ABS8QGI9_9BACI|nr:YlaH-like family protein [Neobacillus sedimentimangrovi]AIM17553.1 membrane protein [Bacillus sp. X1(2014)]MCD4838382.1 YlaH-like family protein [Neobacillus sedimentimangrovi]
MDIAERLTFFPALYKVIEQPKVGMWLLYLTITALSVLVYKLGFAKKLPLGKSIIIYIFLILGSTMLTFLGIFLPIAEGLVVAALILIIYKIRLWQSKKTRTEANSRG